MRATDWIAVYYLRSYDGEWHLDGVYPRQHNADVTARHLRDVDYPVRGVRHSSDTSLRSLTKSWENKLFVAFAENNSDSVETLDGESDLLVDEVGGALPYVEEGVFA